MVASSVKLTANGRDNQLCERLAETAQQPGCVGFCLNREGYAAVKGEIAPAIVIRPPRVGSLFGKPALLIPLQKQRALAFWDYRSLARHLKRFS